MSDQTDLLRQADGIIAHATLIELEETAAREGAAQGSGLALIQLIPGSDVIQLVIVDGVCLGRIRREYPQFVPERWIAVPPAPYKPRGPYRTVTIAAIALITFHTTIERIDK